MATLAPQAVTKTVLRLSAELTADSDYIIQNIGKAPVDYCNYPTDPSDAAVGWRICRVGEWFRTGTIDDTDNPIWVRCRYSVGGRLSIGEAP